MLMFCTPWPDKSSASAFTELISVRDNTLSTCAAVMGLSPWLPVPELNVAARAGVRHFVVRRLITSPQSGAAALRPVTLSRLSEATEYT